MITLATIAATAVAASSGFCGTPDLLDRWHDLSLSDEARHELEWQISPLYRAASDARDVCHPTEAISHDGEPYDRTLTSEHFALHWNDAVYLSDEQAQELSELLEESLDRLTGTRGFTMPMGLEQFEMVVAVERLSGLGGYAWLQPCGDDWIPFFVLNKDILESDVDRSFTAEVVAHELFHTVQLTYGLDEYFLGWEETPNRWWVETGAAYEQGVVWPDGDEYLQWFSTLWATQPWLSIETHNDDGHQYGMFVLPLSIEGSLGSADWHRELWEQLDGRTGYTIPDELDTLLRNHDTSFLQEYGTFLARGAEGDFPRYDFLLGVRDLQLFAYLRNSTAAEYNALDLPIDGALEAGHVEAPEYLGASFVWFGLTQAEENRRFVAHFAGDTEFEGQPVEWTVQFAAVRANEVLGSYQVEPELVDGEWTSHVRLDGLKEQGYEGAWMIASPITRFETDQGGPGWRWSAELRSGTEGAGFTDADAGRGCTGCTQEQPSTAALPLLLLGGLTLRRRPR